MELKFNNVSSKNTKNINLIINENEVTSLISSNEDYKEGLIDLLYGLEKINTGDIKLGRKKLDSSTSLEKTKEFSNKIYYLKENSEDMLFNINIKEDIKYYLTVYNEEVLEELLNSLSLSKNILEKCYLDLSDSEKRKILLIIGLMTECKIVVYNNPTIHLDYKSIQTIIKHIRKQKRKDVIIIILSNDTDFLLSVSDKIIVIDNKQVINQGNKYDILTDTKLLAKIKLKVPNIINFINKVRYKKDIKLGYRDNINDLIKDVYRYAK